MCKRIYTISEQTEMERVRKNQPHICFYCKRELADDKITIDHVQPYARDGKTKERNLVIACKECNSEKDVMTLKEYMDFLEIKKKVILDFKVFEDEFTNQMNDLNNEIMNKNYKYLKKHDMELEMNLKLTIINCLKQEKELVIKNLRKDYLNDIYENLKMKNPLYDIKQKSYPSGTQQIMYIYRLEVCDKYRNMNIKDKARFKYYRDYFIKNGKLKTAITVDENNYITNVNSYMQYLILKESENILAPVRQATIKYNTGFNNITTNIYGNNNNVNINI